MRTVKLTLAGLIFFTVWPFSSLVNASQADTQKPATDSATSSVMAEVARVLDVADFFTRPIKTPIPTRPPATPTVAPSPTRTGVPPTAIATRTPTSSPTSVPTFTTIPTATQTATPGGHLYGIVGQGGLGEQLDTALLQQQYDAGVRLRFLQLGWDVLQPNGPGTWSSGTTATFQQRIDAFAANSGLQLVLDLGIQYPPSWVAQVDPLVDQYGNIWQAQSNSGINVYWSPGVRAYVADYIRLIFANLNFRGKLWAVRVGPYQGELLYPYQANSGANLSFWAFDSNAQAQSPVPGWRPGQPSPNGEAQRFYYWYVDNLAGTFNFFLTEIRRYYAGYVAPVTPGLGEWDGTANQLISHNLYDTSQNYYGTGNYWQRLFAHLPAASSGVINWCSSVGDGSGNESSPNWWDWSSAKMMAYLAHQNGRQIYGENPGHNAYDTSGGADPRTTMQADFATVRNNSYLGLMWISQADMGNPVYASLDQFRYMIKQAP